MNLTILSCNLVSVQADGRVQSMNEVVLLGANAYRKTISKYISD